MWINHNHDEALAYGRIAVPCLLCTRTQERRAVVTLLTRAVQKRDP
jgi:hypothetical protein